MFKSWLMIFCFILFLPTGLPVAAQDISSFANTYRVIKVVDGDTFEATDGTISFRVRIAAMDAPEHDQSFGSQATAALKALLVSETVGLKTVGSGRDRYNRILALVYADNKDVAAEMIVQGLATYYRPFCSDYPDHANKYTYDPRIYVAAEAAAKNAERGIWSKATFVLPCQYRKMGKGT